MAQESKKKKIDEDFEYTFEKNVENKEKN